MMSTPPDKQPFFSLSQPELKDWLEGRGYPGYRAKQVWSWIFQNRVSSFQEMNNLPQKLREELEENFDFFTGTEVRRQKAKDNTQKILVQLKDGEQIECVLMRETSRRTICISTQVGCAMGCVFCASGLLGLNRNLTKAEILEQVLRLDRLLKPEERITNVVVMGIGEPLANLKSLMPVVETMHDPEGLGLGYRRITISTVGLPKKIRELADLEIPFNLAISLHAPNDTLRTEIVPANKNVGIDAIMSAADYFFEKTGRRLSFEYVLLGQINDRPVHAKQLGKLLRPRKALLNLIPMNDVTELPFHQPSVPRTDEFVEQLRQEGLVVTVRKRKGADIDAACGQLRLNEEKQRAGGQVVPLT